MNLGGGPTLFEDDPISKLLRTRLVNSDDPTSGGVAGIVVEPNIENADKLRAQLAHKLCQVLPPDRRSKICSSEGGELLQNYLILDDFATAANAAELVISFQAAVRSLSPQFLGRSWIFLEPDFLKVDIDSIDCVVVDALLKKVGLRPTIVAMEVNPLFPPPLDMMALESEASSPEPGGEVWRAGCSLSAQLRILQENGYSLLMYTGYDAIFINRDFVQEHLIKPSGGAKDEIQTPALRHFLEPIKAISRESSAWPAAWEWDEFECFRRGWTQSLHHNWIGKALFTLQVEDALDQATKLVQGGETGVRVPVQTWIYNGSKQLSQDLV
mmetsp:Transcript_66310/g.158636  ORF Transcript_66310/g.158636 Transcript_66310/m.158636 type:complete len:327 (+) Transcript_66310:1-981(+)